MNAPDKGSVTAYVDDQGGAAPDSSHSTLKYHLLGPSLTKSGQDNVDQQKVSEIIYNASKGSKFFNNEENRDKNLTVKINHILAKKRQLENLDLKSDLRKADDYIAELELTRDLTQHIVHIDCDAFYAAVEELDHPELKDVPFAVGKGVLTTCNYHARKFGCRSGMAGFVADKLCPGLVHLPLNFEKYTAKAKEVRAVLEQYDPRFESASIDEAYLNITNYCEERSMTPEDVVSQVRAEVFEKCSITISAGIAANARLAKICSDKNKPNGQFKLASDRVTIMAFMRALPTRKVNGIGRVFERELDAIGVKTCGDIFSQRAYLSKLFGEKASHFLMGVHLGLGRTSVQPAEEHERKSVGTESTFKDMSDPQELREKLRWIAEELEKDCGRTQFKGRTLVLKIKLHTYEVLTRQVAPHKAVHKADDLYKFSLPMLSKLEKEFPNMTLRLMGLRITHLVSMKKPNLDFFGRQQSSGGGSRPQSAHLDEDGWERWPDVEFEEAARQEQQEELEELERLSQEHDVQRDDTAGQNLGADKDKERQAFETRKHDNGFAWRLLLEEERAKEQAEAAQHQQQEEKWDCPICGLPQVAEDRSFNVHIDACLSKQTIKEIVKTSSRSASPDLRPRDPSHVAKKRGRGPGGPEEYVQQENKKPKKAFFTRN
ncbi:hypothetical protein AAFC00_000520 [Neodothiora populina]|uniref:DNA polymerase kappa n=1 Tax=Neodothiora populina TaxID=2781224 RepID=A0ABR3PDC2_9PEZI